MAKEQESKNTLIILAVVLVLLIFVAGFFLIGGDEEAPVSLEGLSGFEASVIGADALRVISQIENLSISNKLFENREFINLTDRSREVSTEQVGRQNPFSDI